MGPEHFDYALPDLQIAAQPAVERTASRMLVLRRGCPPVETRAADLIRHLPAGCLVVVNETRVVRARLITRRTADQRAFELLVCDPAARGPGDRIFAWVRPARRLKTDDLLEAGNLRLKTLAHAEQIEHGRGRLFEIVSGDLLTTLEDAGQVPLPPYIARLRGPDPDDSARYQTVYARADAREGGSIAAPTAGLHFDDVLFQQIAPVKVCLHVGPGTFAPMDVLDVQDHQVAGERWSIDASSAERIETARLEGRPIVAVGTTVTRLLESFAGPISAGGGVTDLVIRPGFRFKVVDHLLTNFHLPRSSLLMLTCAFGGRERVMGAYSHAVEHGYRFYSYGDCMLLDREEGP